MIKIKVIEAKDTYFIRKEVLRKGIDLPFKFNGDLDNNTFHLGAFLSNELVGIASFMKSGNEKFTENQYQLRGMATMNKARGKGVGKELMEFAIIILRNRSANILWCNAREVAVNFYKKQGFQILGNSFSIDKVGTHYIMYVDVK
ncbi:hypothetical protein WH52_09595 [Tenacibaculum holothuriorum]|uniref:N-acetyltransferase domain-containing protein n=1 Tax=Tenacibaculum holothuriorum TaxID=1635173 RepID=A0A1Y2PDC4_9FLAO|nr:GNAT family N-acetyltransferase [Tenacibaculum holothuriorum]OSY87678.1 hypothetical protein WH52_09595 [Tenacibaculum holothuriorum]